MLLIAGTVLLVFRNILFDPHNIPGVDTYWHFALIADAADQLRETGSLAPWSSILNGGMDTYYATGGVYPMFVYYLSTPLLLWLGSVDAVYFILVIGSFLMMGWSFFLGFKGRFGRPAALLGGLAFMYAPFILVTVSPHGRLPALLALAFLPAFAAGYLTLLERPTRLCWIITAAAFAFVTASHPMLAYMSGLAMGAYTLVIAMWGRVAVRSLVLGGTAVVAGALAVWVLLPEGLTNPAQVGAVIAEVGRGGGVGERAAVDSGEAFSIWLRSFDPVIRGHEENYAGLGLLLATLLIPLLRPRRTVVLLTALVLLFYVLASGTSTPLYAKLPRSDELEPRRFLFFVYLLQAILLAMVLGPWMRRVRNGRLLAAVPIVLLLGLVSWDAFAMSKTMQPVLRDRNQEIADVFKSFGTEGRYFYNSQADAAPLYYGTNVAGLEAVGRLGDIDLAARDGFPETALATLALYDTRLALSDDANFPGLVAELRGEGFNEIDRFKTQVVLATDRPSTLLQKPSRPVMLVGTSAVSYWNRIFPLSIRSPGDISAVSPEYLQHFSAVVLGAYVTSDREAAEGVLENFVASGGVVLIEEGALDGNHLWGVAPVSGVVPRNMAVVRASGEMQPLQPFAVGADDFVGQFYPDAGAPVLEAEVADTGRRIPLIQRRQIDEGSIYYVCCNLGNHTVINPGRDRVMAEALREFLSQRASLPDSLWPEPFDAELLDDPASELAFRYRADESTAVVISLAPSQHWNLTVDGKAAYSGRLLPYGPVMFLSLEAGEHVVALSVSAAFTSIPAIAANAAGLALAILIIGPGWRYLSGGTMTARLILAGLGRWSVSLPYRPRASGTVLDIRATDPRLTRALHFTVPTDESDRRECYAIKPVDKRLRLAVLLVEIRNVSPTVATVRIDEDAAELVSDTGGVYQPLDGAGGSAPVRSINPRFFLDQAHAPLWGVHEIAAGQSLVGMLVFEVPNRTQFTEVRWKAIERLAIAF